MTQILLGWHGHNCLWLGCRRPVLLARQPGADVELAGLCQRLPSGAHRMLTLPNWQKHTNGIANDGTNQTSTITLPGEMTTRLLRLSQRPSLGMSVAIGDDYA